VGHEVQREITDRLLRKEAERKEGHEAACPCGGRATYRGHNELTVVTAGGRVRMRRAYYYCDRCGTGHCPADRRLGLGPANTTPTAQARLAVLAAFAPFVQVCDLVAQLGLPLPLDIKSTERVAQGVGARLGAARLRPFGRAARPVAVGFDGVMYPTWEGNKEARVAGHLRAGLGSQADAGRRSGAVQRVSGDHRQPGKPRDSSLRAGPGAGWRWRGGRGV
jgi:hypothetical protein